MTAWEMCSQWGALISHRQRRSLHAHARTHRDIMPYTHAHAVTHTRTLCGTHTHTL